VQARILGRQFSTGTYPSVQMTASSGEVRAPLAAGEAFDPDSPCIEGHWEHVRYGKGTKSTFIARTFDGFIALCMGDLQSHTAPPDAACFSGLGEYRQSPGNKPPRTVLYRVDMEARSTSGIPGTPDHYRLRLWILTPRELARLADPNDRLMSFRRAVAASEGSMMSQSAPATRLGSAAFGVRPADVDDGGILQTGGATIQPITRICP
jgi:hypothetical protein